MSRQKRLKAFIDFLVNDYHGSMKNMKKKEMHSLRKKLLSVNGIGPETADSILLYALDKPIFVIDAYTKRVLSRHNILGHDEPYDRFQELFHSSLKKMLSCLMSTMHCLCALERLSASQNLSVKDVH